MKHINWSTEKSLGLKSLRGVCFEDIVYYIENGDLLDDYKHSNQERYLGKRIMVIGIKNHAYLVAYIENEEEIFLKTIIPSRKATKRYFGGKNER